MKKIACVGYHATGAGVIDDLLREFNNVAQGTYECESRYLHDADGISDLEYNLVENPHRLNSSLAIRRFIAYAHHNNRQLSKVYGSKWLEYAEQYAQSLIKFEYEGYKGMEPLLYNYFEQKVELLKRGLNKLRPKKYRYQAWHNYYPKKTTFHAVLTESDFLCKTRLFVNNLCESMPHKPTDEYVVIDQMVPGNNIERYLRYVEDLKVIVVDRDPRDLYIRQRTLHDHVLPNDPYYFSKYYKDIRPFRGYIFPDNVLKVSFEDLIYKYDEMVTKILLFLDLDKSHHSYPMSHFKPDISIKGTQTWMSHPEYSKEISIIEKELEEYLYIYQK